MVGAVNDALRHVPLDALDAAAAELAKRYAAEIEGGGDLSKLGPPLLAALESLGMTPRSRRALVNGARPQQSPADELREKRARRAGRTET